MNNEVKKQHLLWLLPKSPVPTSDGARHASYVLIKSLIFAGVEIDLVVLDGETPLKDRVHLIEKLKEELGVANIFLIPRPSSAGSPISRAIKSLPYLLSSSGVPLTFQPFTKQSVKQAMSDLLQGRAAKFKELPGVLAYSYDIRANWDAVVFDGLHTGGYLFDGAACKVPEYHPPIIYRAHNVEVDIWRGKVKSENKTFKKHFLTKQAAMVQELELALLRKVNRACPVSDDDGARLKEILPRLGITAVPIGYDFPDYLPERKPIEKKLLFVGTLDWPPNRDGLEWFLDNIWPEVIARGRYSLNIVGKGDAAWLKKYSKLPGINIKGFVQSLDEEYSQAEVAITPLIYGSGTRVKIIEAARFGCPVISTKLGAQGLNLLEDISFLNAERLNDWVARITQTSSQKFAQVGKESFLHLKDFCNPVSCASSFLEATEEGIRTVVIVKQSG